MTRLAFDLETDGLLWGVTRVWCIAIIDVDTGAIQTFGAPSGDDIQAALELLYNADELIGHNVIGYDFAVLKKLFDWHYRPGTKITDTLVCARLLHPNMKEEDHRGAVHMGKLAGSHSLRAWGMRLGFSKGDYDTGWDSFSQEMLDYCVRDVEVTIRLLRHLRPWEYPPVPLALEHRKAWLCSHIEQVGWPFDVKAAGELAATLAECRDKLEVRLKAGFGSWQEVDRVYTASKANKRRGIVKGDVVTNYKTVMFNPGSRMHIERKLKELGWRPEVFTAGGRAKLDEAILEKIDIPASKLLIEYLLVEKRLGQLQDGDQAWLKVVSNSGHIHGSYNPCGTITGRCTHYSPNIGQVPAVRAPYGEACRRLFGCPPGWKLVAADQSGLELRTLAHYLANFDGGAYAKAVTEGDIHAFNRDAAGLETRDQAKTIIYALLYGAGDARLGKIVGRGEDEGKRIRALLTQNIVGFDKLLQHVACQRGYLKGLDGRRLHIRSSHSALNTLVQGAGATICGQWACDTYDDLRSRFVSGWQGGFAIVGWIHDELQVACREELANEVGEVLVSRARLAGDAYGFRVPLEATYHIGNNWSETH